MNTEVESGTVEPTVAATTGAPAEAAPQTHEQQLDNGSASLGGAPRNHGGASASAIDAMCTV